MTITRNNFEGTDGATIDATSSLVGGDAVTFYNTGGGVCQFDTTRAAHGTRSAHVTTVNGSGVIEGFLPDVTATQYAWRGYIYLTSVEGIQVRPLQAIDQSEAQALLVIIQASGVSVRANSSTNVWTSPDLDTACPLNTWVRFEFTLDVESGAASFATYDNDSTSPLWSQSMGSGWGFASETSSIKRTYFGQQGTAVTGLWLDDVAQDDAAASFIGPAAGAPSGAGTSAAGMATITVTGSGGTPPYTYSISQTGGPTTTPTSISDGEWLVEQDASATLTYQVTVTDATLQNSAPVNVAVDPIPSGSTASWPKSPSGSLPSSTWA